MTSRRILSFLIILFLSAYSYAQNDSTKPINAGIELDVLPYLTGGYFGAVWLGRDHFRCRVLTARVHKPDFATQEGFTNNDVTAYALLADYFLKENWKGWWIATGPVYWRSSIQTDDEINTAYYNTWLWNGSIGYNFSLCKIFYVSPWVALNVRIGGNKNVAVDGETYSPPLFNPEASLKFGVYF